MSKYLDHNGLLYVWGKIKALVSGKVDKVEGKGLSSNDFTTAEKTKLAGLSNYTLPEATATTLGGVKVKQVLGESDETFGEKLNTYLRNGVLYALSTYASTSEYGVIKVGDGLNVDEYGVLSAPGGGEADSVSWSNITGKPDIALKSDLSSVYKYKGSKANYASLPATGNTEGDVWNVEATGMNYAWTGETWDALGQTLEIESITNAEIDSITAG